MSEWVLQGGMEKKSEMDPVWEQYAEVLTA